MPCREENGFPPFVRHIQYSHFMNVVLKRAAILYYLLFSFEFSSSSEPSQNNTWLSFFFFPSLLFYYCVSSQGQGFLLPCSLRVMKRKRCIERLSARRIGWNMKSLILKFKEMKSKLNFYFHGCNLKRYTAEFLHLDGFSYAL